MKKKQKEQVLIVGGGFGGVKAALTLAEDDRFNVSLLSDDPELRYYPTLYHTATGGKRANSSIPLSKLFAEKSVKLINGTAVTLDRKAKTITTSDSVSYPYDSLILGLGVVTNYFGIPGLQDFSFSIKTQSEAARFKEHLHKQLIDEHKPDLNYVIVGGGPTGIELAGSLPSYIKQLMKNHGIKHRAIHIDLIESSPRLLPRLPNETSKAVKRQLSKVGVKLYLGSIVQGESADSLTVSGKPILSHTVVWTAGVTNHPFFSENHFAIMGRGKVGVDTYLQAEENIYVIGDNANTPFSGLAQTALRDGQFVAENLIRRADNKPFNSYEAKSVVTVIPAGPHWAAVVWGNIRFNGKLGWLLREGADLIGFHDLEPWKVAAKQWASEFYAEDDCTICAVASID